MGEKGWADSGDDAVGDVVGTTQVCLARVELSGSALRDRDAELAGARGSPAGLVLHGRAVTINPQCIEQQRTCEDWRGTP